MSVLAGGGQNECVRSPADLEILQTTAMQSQEIGLFALWEEVRWDTQNSKMEYPAASLARGFLASELVLH